MRFTSPRRAWSGDVLDGFDAASRRGPARWRAGRVRDPGPATVYNVRRMVARTLRFMDRVGPVVWEGFTFDGGYTDRVTSGDGDLLTADDQQDALQARIRQALTGKAATHRLHEGNAGMTPHLASIGG